MGRLKEAFKPKAAKQNNYSHLRNNTNPVWYKDAGLRKNVFHCVGLYFCVFYLGYDASLMNGLQAIPQWESYFNNPSGSVLGFISASLFLPAIVTPFMASWINGRWGRKICLAVGSLLLILGAFLNAFATNLGTFIGGRVIIGAAGPFGKIVSNLNHRFPGAICIIMFMFALSTPSQFRMLSNDTASQALIAIDLLSKHH